MKLMKSALLGTVLLLHAVVAPSQVTPACPVPQSPRNVDPRAYPSLYNGSSDKSIVVSINSSQDEVVYLPRGSTGRPETLYRCGQHYHVPVENVQGCTGETEVITAPGTPPKRVPSLGQWIEVHTVYSSIKPVTCDKPETLACCSGKTILVLGFDARASGEAGDWPIQNPLAGPLAEWSGSNTGPDKDGPTLCKDTAAAWSFRLGCEFKVNQAQLALRLPGGPQAARPVQGGPRVSKDLYLVQGGATAYSWTHPDLWKPLSGTTCENQVTGYRCLFNDVVNPTSTIEVRDSSDSDVRFTYKEWHSVCRSPGRQLVSKSFSLKPNDTVMIDVLNPGIIGTIPITCREGFITACEKLIAGNYQRVNCPGALSVTAKAWRGNL